MITWIFGLLIVACTLGFIFSVDPLYEGMFVISTLFLVVIFCLMIGLDLKELL